MTFLFMSTCVLKILLLPVMWNHPRGIFERRPISSLIKSTLLCIWSKKKDKTQRDKYRTCKLTTAPHLKQPPANYNLTKFPNGGI